MRHTTFAGNLTEMYSTAILIKEKYFKPDKLAMYYVNPLVEKGLDRNSFIAFDLEYPNDKITATQAKKYLGYLMPAMAKVGVNTILVADATYFKLLTGAKKADQQIGYILPCTIKGYTYMQVAYCVNYGVFLHNPNHISRLDLALTSVHTHLSGGIPKLGQSRLVNPQYFFDLNTKEAQLALTKLLNKPALTCDIETYGLHIDNAGMASIAFSWNQTEGVAFYIDNDSKSLDILKRFFERYRGNLIFHNATFDIKHIIYTCFMKSPMDHIGMLHGLDIMTRDIHDTKIIAYLALNSTAGNELGLKVLAHPYMGDWGIDLTDTSKIPKEELLTYNLEDCIATYYTLITYLPKMIHDEQEDIYKEIMLPSLKVIILMELIGMPMDMDEVIKTKSYLEDLETKYMDIISNHKYVKQAEKNIQTSELTKINSKLKTKQHTMDKVAHLTFNPGSSVQLGVLLYDVLSLPVLDKTPAGSPSTGSSTINKLVNHVNDPDIKMLLITLDSLSKVTILLSTFIPAFLKAMPKEDGHHYLHGSFNLGGTLSGRLSSSNPVL